MSISSDRIKEWRKKTKNRLLEAFGNKCVVCGYNKCSAALEFHHVDPKTKSFGLGSARASIKNWNSLIEEAKKCVVLCAICHREFHEGLIELPKTTPICNVEIEKYKEIEKENLYDFCKICGTKKRKSFTTCSAKCSGKKRSKINWDKIDLKSLYEQYSLVEIGKMLGVSDNAVRKQLLKRNMLCRG